MNKIILLAVFVVLGFGGFLLYKDESVNKSEKTVSESLQSTVENQSPTQSVNGYKGGVLAGKSSLYLDFNKEDYNKALKENKIIFLNFYANWCPICRAEEPDINSGFDALNSDKIIGLRVSYNDSDTNEDEKKLAKEFGVLYQHTKIIIKNSKQVKKETAQWDKDQLINELTTVAK